MKCLRICRPGLFQTRFQVRHQLRLNSTQSCQVLTTLTRNIEIEKNIFNEAEHYRTVAKKHKKAQTATHYTAVGLGSVAAALSVSGVATSLTGPRVIIGAPLGGIVALFGAASAALTETSKKLGHKVTKHENIGPHSVRELFCGCQ